MRQLHALRALIVLLTIAASHVQAIDTSVQAVPATALEQYVAKPDASYSWNKRREGKLGAGTFVELTLTSQTWRGIAWKHQLFIYRPSNLEAKSQALLLIAGGSWNDSLEQPPGPGNDKMPREATVVASLAEIMRAPVAVLMQVPEQPLFGGKKEDEIISYTFEEYMKSGDAEWPLLLPMVKSAVRAMDAVQEFTKAEWHHDVQNFLVTGASKRGWTTWLTAAVDRRVNALAPMVINMLNMRKHMDLQQESFGGYSEQIADYTEKGLQNQQDTPRAVSLRAIVDPYSYRGQLPQPKLIILGTNDRYWPVDSANLYWDALEGDKYMLYVPNNGHSISDYPRVLGSVLALYQHVADKKPLPKLSWRFTDLGDTLKLQVSSDMAPQSVTAWTANAKTRDFRDAQWTAQPAQSDQEKKDGSFVVHLTKPSDGFAAVFAEAQFNGRAMPFYLSTDLRVTRPAKAVTASAGGN
jgi:PhoPQ-activated pathogenicity-related protein